MGSARPSYNLEVRFARRFSARLLPFIKGDLGYNFGHGIVNELLSKLG